MSSSSRPFLRYDLKKLTELSNKSIADKKTISMIIYELSHRKTKSAKQLYSKLTNSKLKHKRNIKNKNKRPYIGKKIYELEDIFKQLGNKSDKLFQLANELKFRNSKRALKLKKTIDKTIDDRSSVIEELIEDSSRVKIQKRTYYSDAKQEKILKKLGKKSMSLTEREKKIYEMRKKGLTLIQIGDKFDVTRERIRKILVKIEKKGFELPKNPSGTRKSAANIKEENIINYQLNNNKQKFIKEYRKNLSDTKTANNLGLSLKIFKKVSETLIENGEMDRRLKIFDEEKYKEMKAEWDEIEKMRQAGYTNKKIASILGTSLQMISIKLERMRSNGYLIRPYGPMNKRDYSLEKDQEMIAYRTKAIRELNNQGLSKEKIARKIGIGSRDLYRHIDLYMVDY